jgi:hypothetical protein
LAIRAKTGKQVTIAMDANAHEEGTFFLISLCRKNYNGNLLCNNQHREMIENIMPESIAEQSPPMKHRANEL